MSTLLHVPDIEFDLAVLEIRRVLRAGSLLAIGLWGGSDCEGVRHDDEIHPPRFFSFRSDSRLEQLLSQHGTVERLETWTPAGPGRGTYQCVVLRTARHPTRRSVAPDIRTQFSFIANDAAGTSYPARACEYVTHQSRIG